MFLLYISIFMLSVHTAARTAAPLCYVYNPFLSTHHFLSAIIEAIMQDFLILSGLITNTVLVKENTYLTKYSSNLHYYQFVLVQFKLLIGTIRNKIMRK